MVTVVVRVTVVVVLEAEGTWDSDGTVYNERPTSSQPLSGPAGPMAARNFRGVRALHNADRTDGAARHPTVAVPNDPPVR